MPVAWTERQYDKEATAKLIELFRTFAPVKKVFFNDTGILFVKWVEGHHDHFHVSFDRVNMRKLTLLIFVAVCQLAGAGETEKKSHELNQWNPLQAEYKIHSGNTAYSELPTKSDRALTVHFQGEVAKQVFEQIGPDLKDTCSDAKGDRERRKKGAFCMYHARLENSENSHYRCWIGIDLRTGEGTVRVPC